MLAFLTYLTKNSCSESWDYFDVTGCFSSSDSGWHGGVLVAQTGPSPDIVQVHPQEAPPVRGPHPLRLLRFPPHWQSHDRQGLHIQDWNYLLACFRWNFVRLKNRCRDISPCAASTYTNAPVANLTADSLNLLHFRPSAIWILSNFGSLLLNSLFLFHYNGFDGPIWFRTCMKIIIQQIRRIRLVLVEIVKSWNYNWSNC